jgi:hypothetical protein
VPEDLPKGQASMRAAGSARLSLRRFGRSWYLSSRRRAASRQLKAEIAQSVEHATENRGVASSILALGTINGWRGLSSGSGSVGRASPCQGEGRGFESRLPLHSLKAEVSAIGRIRRLVADANGCLPESESLPLRLVVGQRTLNPFGEVRILEGQPV